MLVTLVVALSRFWGWCFGPNVEDETGRSRRRRLLAPKENGYYRSETEGLCYGKATDFYF